eukprot:22524_1
MQRSIFKPLSINSHYISLANNLDDTTFSPHIKNKIWHCYYSKDDHILGENSSFISPSLKSNQPLKNTKSYIPSCYYHKPAPKSKSNYYKYNKSTLPNFKNNKYKLFFNYNRNTIAYYNGHFGNFNNKIF